MVKRNADGTLFVGEVVDTKPTGKDIIGDKFLVENENEDTVVVEDKPKNKGGRPRKQ